VMQGGRDEEGTSTEASQGSTPRTNREHKVQPQAGARLVKKPLDLSKVFVTGVDDWRRGERKGKGREGKAC